MFKRIFQFICCISVCLTVSPAAAKNIYKYQDEDGIWHFTDRAPDDQNIEFEAIFMEREPEYRVQMRQQGDRRNPVYLVFNDYWGPVEIEVSLADAVNVLSEPQLPARFVIPGQKEEPVVGLGALDTAQGFQYRINMTSIPGRPMPRPVEGIVVFPPIAPGSEYPISQSFQGEATHTSAENEFAVDIAMPIGTTIYAALGGRVMDIEEDFNAGGTDKKQYAHKANHIRILHDDGTMGLYAHLDLASATVRPGARIRAGQPIGRSGNTGFTSGPHLHFVIQQNVGMKLVSIPFQFRSEEGQTFIPRANSWLKGFTVNP